MDFPFPGFAMKKSHNFSLKKIIFKIFKSKGETLVSNLKRLCETLPKANQFLVCCCLTEEFIIVICSTHIIEVAQSVTNLDYLV